MNQDNNLNRQDTGEKSFFKNLLDGVEKHLPVCVSVFAIICLILIYGAFRYLGNLPNAVSVISNLLAIFGITFVIIQLTWQRKDAKKMYEQENRARFYQTVESLINIFLIDIGVKEKLIKDREDKIKNKGITIEKNEVSSSKYEIKDLEKSINSIKNDIDIIYRGVISSQLLLTKNDHKVDPFSDELIVKAFNSFTKMADHQLSKDKNYKNNKEANNDKENINQQPQFILFRHPILSYKDKNVENKIKKNGFKIWKTKNICADHTRDLLRVDGQYVNGEGGKAICVNGKKDKVIYYYGEWEAHAKINDDGSITPILKHDDDNDDVWTSNLKNNINDKRDDTDPIVLGNNFYYFNCKQHHKDKKFLKDVPCGSIIIFGQPKHNKFYFDTVFVVENSSKYIVGKLYENYYSNKQEEHDEIPLSPELMEVGIKPHYYFDDNNAMDKNRTLYIGKKYDNDLKQPFSFFPCKIEVYDGYWTNRFPKIDLKALNIQLLNDSVQSHDLQTDVHWDAITQAVKNGNFLFGVKGDVE